VFECLEQSDVQQRVDSVPRRWMDRMLGALVRKSARAVSQLAKLADGAANEGVRLRAACAVRDWTIKVSHYANLDWRMEEIERDLDERFPEGGH
jgi:hypothetical protein